MKPNLQLTIPGKSTRNIHVFPTKCISRCPSHGFSLIELMITLAVFILLAGILLPNFLAWLPNYRLSNAAMELHSNLQKARLLAIQRGRSVDVVFVAGTSGALGSYFIDIDQNGGLVPPIAGEFSVNLASYGSGVDFGKIHGVPNWKDNAINYPIAIAFGASSFTFNRQGAATNAGSIYLINTQTTQMYAVTIFLSGSGKIRRYQGGAWSSK